MRVLIPELADDAAPIAAMLRAQGHDVLTEPLIAVAPVENAAVDLSGAQGFLVTGPAAARALAARIGVRTFPVFADSLITGSLLQRLGFKRVEAANDPQALARLIEAQVKPAAGALVHPCVAGAPANVAAILTNLGFAVRPLPLFTLQRVATLPPALHATLKKGELTGAIFVTPEAGRAFVTLLQREDLAAAAKAMWAIAVSSVTAAPLRALAFAQVAVPDAGDETAVDAAVVKAESDRAARAAAEIEQARRAKEEARLDAERVREEQRQAAVREAAARAEREAAERTAREREAAEAAAKEAEARRRAEAERQAAELARIEAERRETERAAKAQAELEAAERRKREREVAEAALKEAEARRRAEAERAAAERARIEAEHREAERVAKAEAERRAAEQRARDREAAEAAAKETDAKRRAAMEQAARQAAEKAKVEEEQRVLAAAEIRARVEAARVAEAARLKAEAEQAAIEARERAERLRLAEEAREREARERDARERAAREREAEAARAARAEAAAERERQAEQAKREKAEREATEIAERERQAEKAREKTEREAAAIAEKARQAQEQAAAREKENAARAAREKAARDAAEATERERQAEQIAREKAEREAAEVASHERSARESAARQKAERSRMTEVAPVPDISSSASPVPEMVPTRTDPRLSRESAAEERRAAVLAAQRAAAAREEEAAAQANTPVADTQQDTSAEAPTAFRARISRWFRRAPQPEPTVIAASSPEPPFGHVLESASSATLIPSEKSSAVMDHRPPESVPSAAPVASTPEPVATVANETVSDPGAEAVVPPRGRAAQQQAEDAADASARTQRWRGFGDRPGTETPEVRDEAKEEATPQPEPVRAPRRRRGVMVAGALIALVAITAYLFPRLTHREPQIAATAVPATPAPPPAAIAPDKALADRIAALETRQPPPDPGAARRDADARTNTPKAGPESGDMVGSLGSAVGGQAQQLAALTARVATLEAALGNTAKLDELGKRVEGLEHRSADAASVLALSDRVQTLESTARGAIAEQTARVGMVLAVAEWREAMAAGRPFQLELESVKALSARAGLALTIDDPRIAAHAAGGIATFDQLRERFDETADHVLNAAAVPNGMSGWLARTFERMFAIVTVRRVNGVVEGTTPTAILARAGAYLRDGNLAAAVTEMESLQGPAANAATTWMDEARARVTAERAAKDATAKTIAALNVVGTAGVTTPAPAPTSTPASATQER